MCIKILNSINRQLQHWLNLISPSIRSTEQIHCYKVKLPIEGKKWIRIPHILPSVTEKQSQSCVNSTEHFPNGCSPASQELQLHKNVFPSTTSILPTRKRYSVGNVCALPWKNTVSSLQGHILGRDLYCNWFQQSPQQF